MVTEFGMSDTIGAINYEGNKRARFLDIPMPQERGLYGEETAQRIDAEIQRILTEAHNTARRVITDHRDKLEIVTARLLEVEGWRAKSFAVCSAPPRRRLLARTLPCPPSQRRHQIWIAVTVVCVPGSGVLLAQAPEGEESWRQAVAQSHQTLASPIGPHSPGVRHAHHALEGLGVPNDRSGRAIEAEHDSRPSGDRVFSVG